MISPRRAEFQDPLVKPPLSVQRKNKKLAVYVLSAFIVVAMATWVGFLGWGMHTFLRWLLDCIKTLSIA